MKAWLANLLVFVTSAAVLVLEILAGRLMAPYLGISLETFTGVIGTVLAGIAAGAWAGGQLADTREPARLVGPAMVAGGLLAWLSLPIVDALGPELGDGPVAIVLLTAAAFFLPAAVLTAVTPMVTKLRLRSLAETGTVVGGLSAAGTVGALAGTFFTGFVLVAAFPTRPTVIALGALLVVSGLVLFWYLTRRRPSVGVVPLVVIGATLASGATGPCEHETGYHCVEIRADPDDPTRRSLYLDRVRNAAVDVDDPMVLAIRYVRLFAAVADAFPPGALETVHVGGGGLSFPRYLEHTRPGSTDVVVEIDAELVRIVEQEFGIGPSDQLEVLTGDARLALRDLDDGRFDLAVGDAFAGLSVPWHLTTTEFVADVARVLRPGGVYVLNVIDGQALDFARAELATLAEHFTNVAVVVPAGTPARRSNYVLVASDAPLPSLAIGPDDGNLLSGPAATAWVDGAEPLRDDFAPVDQMLGR